MATVGRLIKGGLGARLYLVAFDGFDTHGYQKERHLRLISQLGEAVRGLYEDLAAAGMSGDVLTMTFSEFGRRAAENASGGTDHGAAAPLMLFGSGIRGGLYGTPPDLGDLDPYGNLRHHTEFRSIYATVLQDWFGLGGAATEGLLGRRFDTLPLVADPYPVATEPGAVPVGFALQQNFPNPFDATTTIPYRLEEMGPVRLDVFDPVGRLVRMLVDRVQPAGTHHLAFDAAGLPAGIYFYRLTTPEGSRTKQMTLVR
jgi:hypothetical protein